MMVLRFHIKIIKALKINILFTENFIVATRQKGKTILLYFSSL